MSFGLCVLGCGAFARVFAESIAELRSEIDLYFASRDLARAREYAGHFNAADAFGSYADAAADSRVDALYVCTPHHLHREHVALAARNGKHALVEKPIAGTLADAEAMVQEAESAGVNLMVAENYRFMPTVREARKLLDQGSLGQVRLIQLQEQFPFRPSGWRNHREFNGGGVLIDGGIHKLSVLAYLVGQPCEIYAREVLPGQPGLDAEDGVVIIATTPEGVIGVINHSWNAVPVTQRSWVSISGTMASAHFELGRPRLSVLDADAETVMNFEQDVTGLAATVAEFHRSVLEGREPMMNGRDGIADLTLALKAYESIESGLPATIHIPPH